MLLPSIKKYKYYKQVKYMTYMNGSNVNSIYQTQVQFIFSNSFHLQIPNFVITDRRGQQIKQMLRKKNEFPDSINSEIQLHRLRGGLDIKE